MTRFSVGAVFLACAATAALAGGFWVTVYSAGAPVARGIPDTALVVAAEGCHNPADARLEGTAEGMVDGKRQSIALKFTPTSKPGVYAIKKQWPSEGNWVLSITGAYLGRSTTRRVELLPGGEMKILDK